MRQNSTLIVVGGGAAGFFCAVNAARINPRLQVSILEKSNKLLSKVRISGGGRCNVTHECFEIEELVKKYPRGTNFLKKTFHHFSARHTIEWFAERGVILKTEADGRIFPATNTSQTIIDCLLAEANKFKIQIRFNTGVKKIEKLGNQFELLLEDGRVLQADAVCIACGGFPKSGQFSWLQQLGHSIETPLPSLFTFNMPGNAITALMGVSVEDVTVKISGTKFLQQGPLLVTHWGISGPVVLKLSAWAARELAAKAYQFSVSINWLPQYNEQNLKDHWVIIRNKLAGQMVSSKNPLGLPGRLWLYLLQQAGISAGVQWAHLPLKQQNKLIQILTGQVCEVRGKTTFKEEFVTCGGIKLSEVEPNTMQSRLVPGLFFAGEILDVDGITGGFNFQHAWTSGWIAAAAIAR